MKPSIHLPNARIPTLVHAKVAICKWRGEYNLKAPLSDFEQTNPLIQCNLDCIMDSQQVHLILTKYN